MYTAVYMMQHSSNAPELYAYGAGQYAVPPGALLCTPPPSYEPQDRPPNPTPNLSSLTPAPHPCTSHPSPGCRSQKACFASLVLGLRTVFVRGWATE